jgi:hypothetical protein
MKAVASLMLFVAMSAAILLLTGLVLKFYWTVFMIGWGMVP